jgi:SAM-dependent methyltransferase
LKEYVYQFTSLSSLCQYEIVYQKTLEYLRPNMTVLDWGCGNGHFSYFLTRKMAKTIAFSFDDSPAYLSHRRGFEHVRGSPTEPCKLPFADYSFDLVFSVGVLEHVHETGGDELASLNEIKRVLRRDGTFLCFHFPNRFGWIEPAGLLLGAGHFHMRKYTRADILHLVAEAGFTLLEHGRYNFLPRNKLSILPSALRDGKLGVNLINTIDGALSAMLPIGTQNHYFIARPSWPGCPA